MKLQITLPILAAVFAGIGDGPQNTRGTALKTVNISSQRAIKLDSKSNQKTGEVERGKRSGRKEKGISIPS